MITRTRIKNDPYFPVNPTSEVRFRIYLLSGSVYKNRLVAYGDPRSFLLPSDSIFRTSSIFTDQVLSSGTYVPLSDLGVGIPTDYYKACDHATRTVFVFGEKDWSIRGRVLSTTYVEASGSGIPILSTDVYRTWERLSIGQKVCSPSWQPEPDVIKSGFTKMLSDANLLNLNDFNVLAFIGELKDLRQLVGLFKVKHIDDKLVSDKFLGYSFGVVPLISDLAKIVGLIKGLSPAIDKWQSMASKGIMMNKHHPIFKDVNDSVHEATVLYYHYWDHTLTINMINTVHEERKVIGSAYFIPKVLDEDLIDNLKRKIWGFDKPLSAVWQLMPWSFVVDWIIKVGDSIDKFEASTPLLQFSHASGGYSVSINTSITTKVVARMTHKDGTLMDEQVIGETLDVKTQYSRHLYDFQNLYTDLGKFGPMEWSNTWSSDKTLLSSALLHQRLRS